MQDQPDAPLYYYLLIAGRLDRLWVEWLDKAEFHYETSSGGETMTEVRGVVPDHAALLGILNLVHDLGLTIRHMDAGPVQPAVNNGAPAPPGPA